MNRLFATLAPCLLAAALLAACATMGTQADIERLEQQLEATPNDAGALRDLGVLYMRTRRFEQAQFELARMIDPSLDLATEQVGDLSEVDQMSGDPEDVAGGGPSPTDELVGRRQESLTNSTGTLYIPDQDTRNTPEAQVEALPPPRRPPPRGN